MSRALFFLLTTLLASLLVTAAPASDFFSSPGDQAGTDNRSPLERRSSTPPWQQSDESPDAGGEFLPVDQAFTYSAWREGNTIKVGFASADDYYLYRHRFDIKSDDPAIELSAPSIPEGENKHDEFLGDVQVFHHSLIITLALESQWPGDAAIPLRIDFQGCAEAGLCYSPETRHISAVSGSMPAGFINAQGPDDPSPSKTALDASPEPQPASNTSGLPRPSGSLSMLGLFFLAGLGLTFTPCVLPMLPIVTTLVVGQNARRGRALALSSGYVLGMSLTYAALGTLMGLFGAGLNLQARLQSPWVLVPFALLFILFALWLLDVWRFSPQGRFQQRISVWQDRLRHAGLPGAALAGALSTLIVSPCISAPLAGILVYLSAGADPINGMLALLALGLGMGIPLILVATLGAGWLPRSGPWMDGIRQLFAVALVSVALWLLERLLPPSLTLALWGVLAVLTSVAMGALTVAQTGLWARLRQGIALVILVWGVLCLVGAAQGHDTPWAPLAGSTDQTLSARSATPEMVTVTDRSTLDDLIASADQPVMVDVYADWCISCRRFERDVLTDPFIRDKLRDFQLVRLDVTDNNSEARVLLERYELFGPPALLFFKAGDEQRHLRSQGEIDRRQMNSLLDRARM